jgi:hypothetical protein
MAFFISFSYFRSLLAFDAPSSDYPLDIIQVSTLDSSNIPSSSFSKGELTRINCTVEMALRYLIPPNSYIDFTSDANYRIILSILDSNKTPVFFGSAQNTISRGDIQAHVFEYSTSLSDPSGTYIVNVVVWSGWLPSGKTLSPTSVEVTFSVS